MYTNKGTGVDRVSQGLIRRVVKSMMQSYELEVNSLFVDMILFDDCTYIF